MCYVHVHALCKYMYVYSCYMYMYMYTRTCVHVCICLYSVHIQLYIYYLLFIVLVGAIFIISCLKGLEWAGSFISRLFLCSSSSSSSSSSYRGLPCVLLVIDDQMFEGKSERFDIFMCMYL